MRFVIFLFLAATCGASREALVSNAELRIFSRNKWISSAAGFADLPLTSPLTQTLLTPYYACPWSLRRSNFVDEVFDGGKWTCGVPESAGRSDRPFVVYSFGSAGNDIFETHILSMNPAAEIHVFDPTSTPLNKWHFHEVGLCAHGGDFSANGKTYPCASIDAHMQTLQHSHIDVLKMDVEGAEWDVIASTDFARLDVGQILVEVHDFQSKYTLRSVVEEFYGRLEKAGFLLFSVEPVCLGCLGQYELAFIHRNWTPWSRSRAYEAIERKFDELDAWTHQEHPDYGDRKWGIASIGLYAKRKTMFMYEQLLKLSNLPAPTACELGFMAGHTSLMFLEALPQSTVYSFDLNDNPWTARNAQHLGDTYTGRFHFIPGDSAVTLPNVTGVHCDVLLIDGSKDGAQRLKDIRAFRSISHKGAVLFLDEANNFECVSGKVPESDPLCDKGPYASCSKTYNALSRSGEMVVDACVSTKTPDDGFCVARFA